MKIKTMILAALSTVVLPVAVPLPAYTASASANQCMDQDKALERLVKANRPPQSASSIVHLTNVMFVLDAAMATLDKLCSHEADYTEVRAGYKQARDQAYTACTQLASNASVCKPTPYASSW